MVCLRSGVATVGAADKRQCHLVTGGGGYAGFHLGMELHKKGHKVKLLDVREPQESLPDAVTFLQCDIRNYKEVEDALAGADYVYHLASYGMSGREQILSVESVEFMSIYDQRPELNTALIEQVNITGTGNVIKACQKHCIRHLVYTSTFNVVFGGQTIENGDETLPYLPIDKHPDHYSRTKSIAEKLVLDASGCELSEGGALHTCALRLAGVYGPGEQRHLPRIVGYMQKGLFSFTYGAADSLVEFLHVDNLVQAHVKAAQALSEDAEHVAAGQAYFISDCKPVNNFEFFRPLIEGLGYTYPKITLPITLIYFIAFITEMTHAVIGRVYNFQPLLTRTEVYKTGVTHYFNIAKAKRDLSYYPTVQNDMDSVLRWYLARGYHKTQKRGYTFMNFLRDAALVVIFVAVVMSFLPSVR